MKLSRKISLAAVGFLLLFSQVFFLWLMDRMGKDMVTNIVRQEGEKLYLETEEFGSLISGQSYGNDAEAIYMGRENFIKTYSENTVLFYKEKEIFNSTPYEFDLSMINKEMQERDYIRASLDDRQLLVFSVCRKPYQVVHYRDITDVYRQMEILFIKGFAGAIVLCICLNLVFPFVIQKILKPLYQLKQVSDEFIQGNYKERLPVIKKDEIGEISQAFNHMADQVEKQIEELGEENEKQRRLMGSLAHELKTPMTAIQGYAHTLRHLVLPPEKQEKSLAYIEKECKRLSRLSGKMLELTRLWEGEEIERKKILVAVLFEEVEKTVECRIQEKHLHLEKKASENLWIWGDEDLLISFLINLLDNGCKASDPGGRIELIGNREGLWVVDEGGGIPPEELSKITEPFYMVDKSRARKEGGAGLGLALCDEIARIHKGKLVMENMSPKGFRAGLFTVCLQEGEDLETERQLE